MNDSNALMKELATLVEETGERIAEDYYAAFLKLLDRLNLPDNYDPIPLKLWVAIAQAFADASGYHISLQAEVIEPMDGEPRSYRTLGHRVVAIADPLIFVTPTEDSRLFPESPRKGKA
jgi:hypothetical protein